MKKKIVICWMIICLIFTQFGKLEYIYGNVEDNKPKKSYVLLVDDKNKLKNILKKYDVTEEIENDCTYEVCLNISEQEAEQLSDNSNIFLSEDKNVYASQKHQENKKACQDSKINREQNKNNN